MSHAEIWFITGSQSLYGEATLRQVASDSQEIAAALDHAKQIPVRVVYRPVATTPEAIRALCQEADSTPSCAGLILWMHTFSPAKMWIRGLTSLKKPFVHFHTQFHRDIPWATIDMDYMNLHQSAHGDREAGFLHTRLRRERKVVVGYWQDPQTLERLGAWSRAALAWQDWQGARIARFGDNMREVAVTEGDKVSAEICFGFSVNGYGVGDLVEHVNGIEDAAIDVLVAEYEESYQVAPELRRQGARHQSLRDGARIELGLRSFLTSGNFKGFTTTFEDLHGLTQLPGLAVQRLMAEGYGFAAEGDWKTAALVRAMKVMSADLPGGTSFMEDYTYHLDPREYLVLGAHMLEICPSIAASRPSLEVHPLAIGGKGDPVRLVFDATIGEALNATLVDLGNRFRLLVNEVEAVRPPEKLPQLPVARAVWKCKPDFKTACEAWIQAGGAHHTCYSYSVKTEHLEDLASMAGIELVLIDANAQIRAFRDHLRIGEVYYHFSKGFLA